MSKNKLPGGILTQSILNYYLDLLRQIYPNVQLDNDYISSPITKKSPLKSVSFQRGVLVLDQQVDKSATLPPDPSVKIIAIIRPVSWRERDLIQLLHRYEDIFQLVRVPVVKDSLAGYNTTVLSYGKEQENSGEKQVNYQCRCSFLEIYNEQIGDLLDPTQRNLKIRADAKNGFYVENLTEESVTSYDDVTQILIKGLSNRKVGPTSINSKSSRSHVVFTCVVESWCKVTSSKCISSSKTSRISLVDLAGSNRNKLEDASIKDVRNVRKSLAQLGDVPYRSSCLTHLLQESFGGNLWMIFPLQCRCKGETLSTLRFGQRAKSIQNEPQINKISEDDVNAVPSCLLRKNLLEQSQLGTNQWERILSITEKKVPVKA
ncbi:hypothetical protein MKW92_019479 [Papaver armeniacum]|nr:hypothetical protein MKW92_019479 [Papaver armeniacum]